MLLIRSLPARGCLLLLAAIPGFDSATAQDFAGADAQEVSAHRLSLAGLAKYTQASESLAALMTENPPPCGDDEDVESLDAMAARLDSIPGASAAVNAAGMNSREYALFTASLMQSGVAAWIVGEGGELPAGTSMENAQFFQQHQAELQDLTNSMESIDCVGGDDGEAEWDEEEFEEN